MSLVPSVRIWTYTLTNGTITISESLGLTAISVLLVSGSASVSGSMQIGNMASSALSLSTGNALVINPGTRYPLDGLVIDASAGVVQIIGMQ